MLEQIEKTIYKVAIYIRLSKEDVDRGYDESESIKNQRMLLTEYVQKLGWKYQLIDTYIDQGFTGTNFNRPAFQRMIKDINLGKVNMVVTKDLSRLGRDYIETGEYIEKWFPENNVRYVSLTDGIDTFETSNGNNDIAPFKSILNDMYSKDLSKKIRTALHTMQKQGKWVGGKTPLGYIKDSTDKNKLIIYEPEAKIVRTIFNMAANGNQVGAIRDYLNNSNIPTANKSRYNKDSFWENKTVKNILKNKVYIGTTVQNKRSRISYKNRKIRPNPEEKWIAVENTHDAIIDKKIFDTLYYIDQMQYKKCLEHIEENSKFFHSSIDQLLIYHHTKFYCSFMLNDLECTKQEYNKLERMRNTKIKGAKVSPLFNWEFMDAIYLISRKDYKQSYNVFKSVNTDNMNPREKVQYYYQFGLLCNKIKEKNLYNNYKNKIINLKGLSNTCKKGEIL